MRRFLDIPYAAPPAGRLRFAAPQPHPPWPGVRDATAPGPNAPQPDRSRFGRLDVSPFFAPGWVPGDDYLTVNVWAPEDVTEAAPIVVWLHGGAFVAGSNRAPVYDGSAFARDGVIWVTVNYRLGAPGFLHLPDAPGNRGMLDAVAALDWVAENAAALGGDPEQVTLAGQSAGAILVASILASGAAPGRFRRAVVQSGSGDAVFSSHQAERVTGALAEALRCAPTAEALAAVGDRRLIDALAGLAGLDLATPERPHPVGGIVLLGPVSDETPVDALARAGQTDVDLLIGSNADEAGLYLAEQPAVDSVEALRAAVAEYGPDPDRLVEAYAAGRPSASPDELRVAIAGDAMFGAGTRHLADVHSRQGGRTHVYEFGWGPDALGGRLGACHLVELPFVLGNMGLVGLHGPDALLGTRVAPAGLAAEVHRAWVDFAAGRGPGWDAYVPGAPAVHGFGAPAGGSHGARAAELGAWSRSEIGARR